MRTTMERTDTRVRSPDGVTWTFGPERIEPWPMPQAANPRTANDGGLTTRPCAFPPGTTAIITKPSRAPCAAGSARASDWVLGFEPRSAQFIEPLMGWCGGSDPLRHVELRFPTPEAAVRYAQRQGLRYELRRVAVPLGAKAGAGAPGGDEPVISAPGPRRHHLRPLCGEARIPSAVSPGRTRARPGAIGSVFIASAACVFEECCR
ncbi:MAG TPA: NADH dehydrogenase ubiquinone Fe-S protein 4 [Arenibaculum sp.]|nr:NADH dehydrogenase ubiquinone Fe-S protein 4 [Arenibaculum sp.]